MKNFESCIVDLRQLCIDIGKIQIENQCNLIIKTKSDESPVTNIDLLSSNMIVDYLQSRFPEDVIISEESKQKTVINNTYWLVDPIDGTKDYIKGGNQFCICIAYVESGYPIFGVIYIPSSNEFFYAIQNNGSYLIKDTNTKVEMNSSTLADDCIYLSTTIRTSVMNILKENFPQSKFVFMSSAVKFSKIAENKGHFSMRLGPTYEWDTAAGQCIVEESGGIFLNKKLQRFSYGLNREFLNGPFFIVKGDLSQYEESINQCLSLI